MIFGLIFWVIFIIIYVFNFEKLVELAPDYISAFFAIVVGATFIIAFPLFLHDTYIK